MDHHTHLPRAGLKTEKIPGHWLSAQLGKRVLRPGGLELTRQMLQALAVNDTDHIVELAPGLGATAQLTPARSPSAYTAVEADPNAARRVESYLSGANQRCAVGRAQDTGLPDERRLSSTGKPC